MKTDDTLLSHQVFGYEDPSLPGGWNISTERQQLISSLMTLGAFLSSSMAGPIATVLSRRMTIWAASLLCVVSNVIMMVTTNIGGLYAGRLLLGLANGMFMTFAQLYIQECSPARYRGLMISAFQVWTSVGSLVGTVVDNFTAKIDGRNAYLIPLGLIFIIPVIMSLGLLFVPESPRWLAQHGKLEQARRALRWHRPGSDAEVDREMREIEVALERELQAEKSVAVWDMFRNPVDRRRTILATCALTVQGASGAMYMIGELPALSWNQLLFESHPSLPPSAPRTCISHRGNGTDTCTAYGTYFFQMAGIGSAFENSCILISVGVVAILINSSVITHFGRRRVFLVTGLILCGLAQLLTAVVYTVNPGTLSTGRAIVGLSVVYIFAYNVSVVCFIGDVPHRWKIADSVCWCRRPGDDCDIRLDLGRRAALTASAVLHLWSRHGSRLLCRLAHHIHGPLLHQP